MSKLIYRTKSPKRGWVFNESFMTHERTKTFEQMPSNEIQKEAMELVGAKLRELIQELDKLGYDPTKVRFQIHFKD